MPSDITVQDGWAITMEVKTVNSLDLLIAHLETYPRKASFDSWPTMPRLYEILDNQQWSVSRYRPPFEPFTLKLLFFKQDDILLFKLACAGF